MHELNILNPDVMRAELAYRRERIKADRRIGGTARHAWLRARRTRGRDRNS